MTNQLQIVKSTEQPKTYTINGRVLTYSELAILKKMNTEFAHVVVGGKHQIVSQVDCSINGKKIALGSIDSFHNYFTHMPKVAGLNRGKAWASWQDKAFYSNGIGFYPNPTLLPKGCYNLFDGWHCPAIDGDTSFIINHIKEVLCNGNKQAGKYFIQWLAHIFQYPEIKPTVAVFLKSVEGTGKGSLYRLLQKLLGAHSTQINGAELVTRNFNSILTAKLLIFADEVNLLERSIFDKIKGLISEPTCQLEKKGIEAEPMANLARFIFASNHEQVIPAGKRERRFLLIEASDVKASDTLYWRKFNKLITQEYASHFLHYLMHVDLSDFDPYNAPLTQELIQQKILSFNVVDLFIYDELNTLFPFGGEKRINSTKLMNEFIAWIKEGEHEDANGKKIGAHQARALLARKLQKLGFIKIGTRSDRNGGVFYEVPDSATLREQFSAEHALSASDLFSTNNSVHLTETQPSI